MIRTLRLAAAGACAMALIVAAPAGAIETEAFGIDVADPSPDGRLHIPIQAGRSTTGRLRLWNKGVEPLVMRLSVMAATVDDRGNAKLGGDEAPVRWTRVEPAEVSLAPGAAQQVTVKVKPPRRIDAERRTVAIVAEPTLDGHGATPTVVQRVAVTTFLEPDRRSLVARLGWVPWLGLAVLLLVGAGLARQLAGARTEP